MKQLISLITLYVSLALNISYERFVGELQSKIAGKTDGEYQLTTIKYVKLDKNGKAFGFAEHYPAFCHSSKLVGVSTQEFERICNSKQLCIIHSYPDPKNNSMRATWFCPVENVDEKTWTLISQYATLVAQEEKEREAKNREWKQLLEQQEKEREARVKQVLGGIGYQRVSKKITSGYGGKEIYVYQFDRPIAKETFMAFCEAIGLNTVPKNPEAPICPEMIEFLTIDHKTWEYRHIGEWDD